MTVSLDTHLSLWSASGDPRLSAKAVELISDPAHHVFFSVVSLWEVVIKQSLNRADFRVDASLLRTELLQNGYEELPISGKHALGVARLPKIHADPFDRLLVAQAHEERMMLLTSDPSVAAYSGN